MATHIAILAQDLIWSDRLARAVEAAGAEPLSVRTAPEFERALGGAKLAIVDLTARAYDPLAALELAGTVGVRVIAVGQHDDRELRRRAIALGAERVYAYRKLFEDGPGTIERWLASPPVARTEEARA